MIKAVIGLGNPGKKFEETRHNIGFLVLDRMAEFHNATWQECDDKHYTSVFIKSSHQGDRNLLLVKPQTYMNNSGDILGWLLKKGIKPLEILVVHDELEKRFGSHMMRLGGSARGHNGLRSIISVIGQDFWRLRAGIDRPTFRDDVSDYVLAPFTKEEQDHLPRFLKELMFIALDHNP